MQDYYWLTINDVVAVIGLENIKEEKLCKPY